MERTPHELKRLIAQSYDRIAERYLELRAEQHREGVAPRTALLHERLEQRSSVLDLGCGAGIPLSRMLAETFDVTGVDISTRQIEQAPLHREMALNRHEQLRPIILRAIHQ
jgi:2-polyprenyl-3-methyl-5-hydroxy-6-metoxy-1,4-benzoquinol methylase